MNIRKHLPWLTALLLSSSLGLANATSPPYLLPLDNGMSRIGNFFEGLARVHLDDNHVGFIDTAGKRAFKATFAAAGTFHDGLAWVRKSIEGHDRYGFIDRYGKLVIPYQFDAAHDFSCKRAVVRRGDRWLVIDRHGRKVMDDTWMKTRHAVVNVSAGTTRHEKNDPGDFHNCRMKVYNHGKYGFVNADGKRVIDFKYDAAVDFADDAALVYQDGRGMIIDRSGKVLYRLADNEKPDWNWQFSDGLLLFHSGRFAWGFMTPTGNKVVPAHTFNRAPFAYSDGVSVSQVRGKRSDNHDGHMIVTDTHGDVVAKIPFCSRYGCIIDSRHQYHEGLLAVKVRVKGDGAQWGFIDKHGTFVIAPHYSFARSFQHGFAIVRTDNGRVNYLKNPLQ